MPTIQPVNDKEAAWIKDQLTIAAEFIAEFSPADAGAAQPLTPAVLDRAFTAWMMTAAAEPPDEDAIDRINAD
jgi:hypothetical protein